MRKLFLILMTLMACTWSLAAQTRTYHGTIVDAANNEPLIGATVMPVGGGNGTAADIEGNFTITVPSNVKKATFSYVGYNTQTLDLRDGMTVKLAGGDTTLDNVVVVAYGRATKESLTGSVAVVGSQEIEDRPITSVTSALEGNAPGVQVNTAVGPPGTAPQIAIRGFNSITGSSTPLYVVDGVPFEGSIADLNPADIESMSVLKDAASSALYGNRGANGVILITTKKAKKVGKVDVTLQMRQGMYNRGLPFYDRLDVNDWMQVAFDANVNGLWTQNQINDPLATRQEAIDLMRNGGFMTQYARLNLFGGVDAEGNPIGTADNDLFDENGKFFGGTMLPGYQGDRDWWKIISRSGHRQEYTVNAAAAGEKYNVFASAGYLKENGYMLMTDFERFNGRINANFNPVSYLKFGFNLAATAQESQTNASGEYEGAANNPFLTMFMAPIYPYYAHDEAGNIIYEDNVPQWNTAGYLNGTNVAATMRLDNQNNSATVIDGTAYATAVIPYGFELTFRGNMHRDKTHSTSYMNNVMGSGRGIGLLSNGYGNYKNHTFQQMLEWNHDYGLHHVDVLLDHENFEYYSDGASITVRGQNFENMLTLGNFNEADAPTESVAMLRSESYLGRVRYNYDNRYFGEVSLRRDGSSRFAKGHRWGTFWSIGGSWIINQEKWMRNVNWVDYLKLRAAYGSVGNDATAGAYAYYPLYGTIPYLNIKGLLPVQLASDNVVWESTKTFDIALEGNLWRKFNFSVGFFHKLNDDLLYDVTRPASAGMLANTGSLPTLLMNVGSMQNVGWEISLGYTILDSRDWFWDVHVDATTYKNKIRHLPNGRDIVGQALFQGHSMGTLYNYVWAGVDLNNGRSLYELNADSPDFWTYGEDGKISEKLTRAAYETMLAAGMEAGSIVEIDGKLYSYETQYASRQIIGKSLPDVYGSLSTNLRWKNLSLGILFTYSLGGKTYDNNYVSLMGVGQAATALHKDLLKSWTGRPEWVGEDQHVIDPNGIPELNSENEKYNNAASSRWYTSKSYLYLKNINLNYDMPRKWVDAMKMTKLSLGCSIDNLFLVSSRKGLNPSYGFGSGQSATYVPSRVFSFSVTAQF
ncbi:MAG: SusC/RagA family TonB-linked outer membrane protein [Muribaculaceae bacterium]|nr:SusC/RagA family TonB-linked outer membrane protein [Muribaculaceae bacterium]